MICPWFFKSRGLKVESEQSSLIPVVTTERCDRRHYHHSAGDLITVSMFSAFLRSPDRAPSHTDERLCWRWEFLSASPTTQLAADAAPEASRGQSLSVGLFFNDYVHSLGLRRVRATNSNRRVWTRTHGGWAGSAGDPPAPGPSNAIAFIFASLSRRCARNLSLPIFSAASSGASSVLLRRARHRSRRSLQRSQHVEVDAIYGTGVDAGGVFGSDAGFGNA